MDERQMEILRETKKLEAQMLALVDRLERVVTRAERDGERDSGNDAKDEGAS